VAGATAKGAGRTAGTGIDLTRTQKLRKPPELFTFIGLSAPGGTRTRMPKRAQVLNLPRMPIPPPGHCQCLRIWELDCRRKSASGLVKADLRLHSSKFSHILIVAKLYSLFFHLSTSEKYRTICNRET
jgi:hypothetical protein